MKDYINVITKQPGQMFRARQIKNELEALQAEVGGYIETVTFNWVLERPRFVVSVLERTRFVVICDEEGRLKGYEPNCRIGGVDFCGPIIICGVDGDEFTDVPAGIDPLYMSKVSTEAC